METATVATLLIVGALLLFAEVFLPGMIAGAIGMVCIGIGVVLSFVYFGVSVGMVVSLGALIGLGIGTVLWFKYFPETRIAGKFISKGAIGGGGVAEERQALVDQTGVAATDLRPSGIAKIDGKRVDVVTEGQMIDKDTPVRVVAVEGLRIVVRTAV
jgi:membrane-bound serine protease (ClpP class)